jgi:hypothetical protein
MRCPRELRECVNLAGDWAVDPYRALLQYICSGDRPRAVKLRLTAGVETRAPQLAYEALLVVLTKKTRATFLRSEAHKCATIAV